MTSHYVTAHNPPYNHFMRSIGQLCLYFPIVGNEKPSLANRLEKERIITMSNATFSNSPPNRSNGHETTKAKWPPANAMSLGRLFFRLGWIGFGIQAVLVSVPIILLFYVMFVSSPESVQRKGIDLSNYLSYGSLVVMVFTTYWFFRYTRLAQKIPEPESCPPRSSVLKMIWIGVWASCLGIGFSILLLLRSVWRLLAILLANPQTGIPFAGAGGDPTMILTAFDGISLTTLVLSLSAELIVLALSLWLLFRVSGISTKTADV